MAYIATEKVKKIRELIKKALPDGYKVSITRINSSEVNVSLLEGDFDFNECFPNDNHNHAQLNHYWPDKYPPVIQNFILLVKSCMDEVETSTNRNAGDPGADYPDYNYFQSIYIGKWDKPYKKVSKTPQ